MTGPADSDGHHDRLSAHDAAAALGINARTIRRAIARGDLPAVKVDGVFQISTADLDRFRAHREARPHSGHRSLLSQGNHSAQAPWLPVPVTPLVGRANEVAAAHALLADPGVRLITLTGPGGVGKTRLALAIAADLETHVYPSVVFVPLEAIRDPALVVGAIARAFGVVESGDRPILDALLAVVRYRRQVIILDNFEQVLPAAEVVARLLGTGSGIRVLITSREPLRLRGEHELVVQALALPAVGQRQDSAAIARAPAVELFMGRARAIRPDFALTDDNASIVAEICRRLDGLPLAIELAAAQIKHLSVTQLLARLDHGFEALADGPRDLPDRLQTMRNAIAWSYDLLETEEQAFLRLLSVFAGGFSEAAVRAIHANLRHQDPEVAAEGRAQPRKLLTALIDKSLLQHERGGHEADRYRLLETIRAFAFEQLLAHDEADQLKAAHASYYLSVVEELARDYHGPNEIAVFSQFDMERDNIRAAFTWSIGDRGDASLGLRLGSALWWYWYVRGELQEGWQWMQALLAQEDAVVAPGVKADGLFAAGALAFRMVMPEQADLLLRDALMRYQSLGHARGAVLTRCSLGYNALFAAGDTERALPLLHSALAEAVAIEDRWAEAATCNGLTLTYLVVGDLDAARIWGERTVALSKMSGDVQGSATAHGQLGQISRRSGDATAALDHFRQALTNYERIGDRGNVCLSVEALAGLVASLGWPRPAAALFAAAAEVRQRIGSPVSANERLSYEADLAAIREALGDAAFADAWTWGKAVSLPELVEGLPWDALAQHQRPGVSADVPSDGAHGTLTQREREVWACLARGHTDKEIGALLSISPQTVSKHVSHLRSKLGVPTRTAAAIRFLASTIPDAAGQ